MIAFVDVARDQFSGHELFFLRKKWPHSSVVVNHVEQSHELVMFTHIYDIGDIGDICDIGDIGVGRHFDLIICTTGH